MLYLDTFAENDFRRLDAVRATHCVSLYMPTHPSTQEALQKDRVLLQDLMKDVRRILEEAKVDNREITAIEEHLQALENDDGFWHTLADGLAVFVAPDRIETYRVPMSVTRAVEVSDRFHLKPLLPLLTAQPEIYLLEIAQNRVCLLKVTEGDIRSVDVPDLPKDIREVMYERGVDHQEVLLMEHAADKKVRQRQFCRAIERAMRAFLRGRKVPLVLAGVDTILTYYREVDTYDHTLPEAITGNQERANPDDLAQRARDIASRDFGARLGQAVNRVDALLPDLMSSKDLMAIARAAQEARVELLVLNIDETIYGTLEGGIGRVAQGEKEDAATYDVLDELAGMTIRTGGQVIGAHAHQLPDGWTAGAVFRYRA